MPFGMDQFKAGTAWFFQGFDDKVPSIIFILHVATRPSFDREAPHESRIVGFVVEKVISHHTLTVRETDAGKLGLDTA